MIKYRILHNEYSYYSYKVQWKFKYFPFWFSISGHNGFHSIQRAKEVIKRRSVHPLQVWEGTSEDL